MNIPSREKRHFLCSITWPRPFTVRVFFPSEGKVVLLKGKKESIAGKGEGNSREGGVGLTEEAQGTGKLRFLQK